MSLNCNKNGKMEVVKRNANDEFSRVMTNFSVSMKLNIFLFNMERFNRLQNVCHNLMLSACLFTIFIYTNWATY